MVLDYSLSSAQRKCLVVVMYIHAHWLSCDQGKITGKVPTETWCVSVLGQDVCKGAGSALAYDNQGCDKTPPPLESQGSSLSFGDAVRKHSLTTLLCSLLHMYSKDVCVTNDI